MTQKKVEPFTEREVNEAVAQAIKELFDKNEKLSEQLTQTQQALDTANETINSQKQMLQNSLNIITQPSSERECELEAQCDELKADLSFIWKWIERCKWDEKETPGAAIDILVHYPNAPWNKFRENWDTSHKEYDAEITEFVEDKERLKVVQQALDRTVEALKEIERIIPIETGDKLGFPMVKICKITLEALASIKE
jgi:hypothetical protein